MHGTENLKFINAKQAKIIYRKPQLMQNFHGTLGGMCRQQWTPHHRHCIQEMNVVIKIL
jgi:hypothetical protein